MQNRNVSKKINKIKVTTQKNNKKNGNKRNEGEINKENRAPPQKKVKAM